MKKISNFMQTISMMMAVQFIEVEIRMVHGFLTIVEEYIILNFRLKYTITGNVPLESNEEMH